jgi:hypothetical protein
MLLQPDPGAGITYFQLFFLLDNWPREVGKANMVMILMTNA